MAQKLFTTLLHNTICVVVGRYDYSARHWEIIFQMLYDHKWSQSWYIPFEKMAFNFSMGVLGNSWSSVWELAILLGRPDSWLCPRGQRRLHQKLQIGKSFLKNKIFYLFIQGYLFILVF